MKTALHERAELAALGNTLNVARAIEELTKALDHACNATAWAVRAAYAEGSATPTCRGLPSQTIRGCHEPVAFFALVDRTRPRVDGQISTARE